MDRETRLNKYRRNPHAQARHRRESFWQIKLPLLIGFALVMAAVVGIVVSATKPTTELGRWADISLIWVILPALFFTLILVAILGALVVGISFLLRTVPHLSAMVLLYAQLVEEKVHKISDKMVEPFIKTNSTLAAIGRFFKRG